MPAFLIAVVKERKAFAFFGTKVAGISAEQKGGHIMCSVNQGVAEIIEAIQEVTAKRDVFPMFGKELSNMEALIKSVLARRTNTLWVYEITATKERGVVPAPTEAEATGKIQGIMMAKMDEDDTYPFDDALDTLSLWPAELDQKNNYRKTGVLEFY